MRRCATILCAVLTSITVLGGPCPFWSQAAPANAPSARERHAMVFDSARGVVVLFGGSDAAGLDGETWEWNGANWTLRSTTGPSARRHHAMAYDSARGVTVLFGGRDTVYQGDTWEWNGTTWTLRSTSGPAARAGHAMAFDASRGVTVLFGGYTTTTTNDTWEWNGTTWTLRASGGPSRRVFHGMAYDSARNVSVMFGGLDSTLNRLGDTWEWGGTSWTQVSTIGPSERLTFALAFDSAAGVTTLFGGFDGDRNDETWDWNGVAWTQRVTSGPSARDYCAMAYDSARGELVLFGGFDSTYDGETWLGADLDLVIDQQPVSASACTGGSASFTVAATNATSHQWRRNGSPLSNGGNISGATGATLTINPVGPGDAASYDCVVTGPCGSATSAPATLSVSSPPSISDHPDAATRCPGVSVSFGVTAGGTGPLSYQWRRNGMALTNGGAISGATSAALTIDPVATADAGNYDVVVSNACGSATSSAAALSVWDSCLTGDVNCDGAVDNFDIDPFVFALINPEQYVIAFPNCPLSNADANLDGSVDNFDIDSFVALLTGG
ncbi:MAG: immunoglobulin domain-containing protein [Phycisphaerales bacterium]|nr:immunoglobulin domain-containing protein [Phycisphaerales bacterium]